MDSALNTLLGCRIKIYDIPNCCSSSAFTYKYVCYTVYLKSQNNCVRDTLYPCFGKICSLTSNKIKMFYCDDDYTNDNEEDEDHLFDTTTVHIKKNISGSGYSCSCLTCIDSCINQIFITHLLPKILPRSHSQVFSLHHSLHVCPTLLSLFLQSVHQTGSPLSRSLGKKWLQLSVIQFLWGRGQPTLTGYR